MDVHFIRPLRGHLAPLAQRLLTECTRGVAAAVVFVEVSKREFQENIKLLNVRVSRPLDPPGVASNVLALPRALLHIVISRPCGPRFIEWDR